MKKSRLGLSGSTVNLIMSDIQQEKDLDTLDKLNKINPVEFHSYKFPRRPFDLRRRLVR